MISKLWEQAGGVITAFDDYDRRRDSLRGLLASVDAPLDSELYYNNIYPGKAVGAKWKGYRLEMLGIVVGNSASRQMHRCGHKTIRIS